MSDGNHTCSHCGRQWFDVTLRAIKPMFCAPECADAWYDAHPADKARANWMTRADLVDKVFRRRGLMPRSRATPVRGDN